MLRFFVQAATAAKEAAMGIYVQQQLEYVKLWKLVEFSQVLTAPESLIFCSLTSSHSS